MDNGFRVHLMEPYRSAFIARCAQESLIVSEPPGTLSSSDAIRTCGTPELIRDALQLAVLADDISFVWTEPTGTAKDLPHLKLAGLEHLGVVTLVGGYPPEVADFEKRRWADAESLNDLWTIERDELDAYSSVILDQLQARGKPIHWSLYRLLRAARLGEHQAIPLILTAVPSHLSVAGNSILTVGPRTLHEYDLPILSSLQEIRMALAAAASSNSRVAGAPLTDRNENSVGLASGGARIWAMVVEELVGQEIHFPVPTGVADVLKLRARTEIVDFRRLVVPFLESIARGDEEAVRRLHREIRQSVAALKRVPGTSRLARWAAYASLAAGVAEAVLAALDIGVVGPSLGEGLLAVGLDRLAERWKTESRWIYLARAGSMGGG